MIPRAQDVLSRAIIHRHTIYKIINMINSNNFIVPHSCNSTYMLSLKYPD